MNGEILATSKDGTLNYLRLTPKYLEESINVLKNYFMKDENVHKAVRLAQYPQAVAESEQFVLKTAYEGISVIAIDKTTDKVAGVCFNTLFLKNEPLDENYFKNLTHPAVRDIITFGLAIEEEENLYEMFNADCLFETLFLSTVSEYRGKGIAKKLCEISIEIAQKLHKGENVRLPLDENALPLDFRPKLVTSLFTSFITQKIGRQLNFTIINSRDFTDFTTHDGRNFGTEIGDHTKNATYEYKLL